MRTRHPLSAAIPATLAVTLVLPTPPLPLAKAIVLVNTVIGSSTISQYVAHYIYMCHACGHHVDIQW